MTGPGLARCDEHASGKEKTAAYIRAWQKSNPLKVQLWDRRHWARKNGVPFTITVADLEEIWPGDNRCPVCKVELTRDAARPDANGSIDRLTNDHSVGYVLGNVHVV